MKNQKIKMVQKLAEFMYTRKEMDGLVFEEKQLPKNISVELKYKIQFIDRNVNKLHEKIESQSKQIEKLIEMKMNQILNNEEKEKSKVFSPASNATFANNNVATSSKLPFDQIVS